MSDSFIPPGTVHFNQSYMNYQYEFNGFPTVLAIIPWFYMLPTLIVILKIASVYLKTDWDTLEAGKNQYVFLVISLSLIFSYIFFVFDYIEVRLPATGYFTSYCAGIAPNHWLKMVIFLGFYSNYCAMAFPFLMPVVRLMILMYPKDHNKYNVVIMIVGVPLILIYPIACTFFLLPAIGTCKQLEYPYPFGSIWVYYYGAAFGMRNSTFYMTNSIIWLIFAIIANIALFYKLRKAKERLITVQTSGISHRALVSVTKTTVVMITFYVTNGIFILSYYQFYGTNSLLSYSIVLRPFGNELQIVMVAWIFYCTHPVFKKAVVNTEMSFERREHTK
ncbi:hypothetical protein GCK72_013441 [Caenorhabditis remanei]|uniref:Uncharacterized protein n=1 Tax=Caenorhabditis remanei TaxID=31234 RepID=A0A6A5GR20_CAERE|nr:hypothetical protein GCK72_013441 [Caenorhabditis remanei]KAF1756986.1 hypothetical protein GCK72_013441 [Caenorhabditis remanei]